MLKTIAPFLSDKFQMAGDSFIDLILGFFEFYAVQRLIQILRIKWEIAIRMSIFWFTQTWNL